MGYEQKVEGQQCTCGAKYVKNPKTGKVFCEAKCWLNAPNQGNQQPTPPGGQNTPNSAPVDWDKVNKKKEKGMTWLNAKNNACLIIANKPELKVKDHFQDLAELIYLAEAPKSLDENLKEAKWSGIEPDRQEDVPTIQQEDEIPIPF